MRTLVSMVLLGGLSSSAVAKPTATVTITDPLLAAVQLPLVAIELRAGGVPAPEVAVVLHDFHVRAVPMVEVIGVLQPTVVYVHRHGPIPHFDTFVTLQLEHGVRGPRLVQVLRAEHVQRGRGASAFAPGHGALPPGHGGTPPGQAKKAFDAPSDRGGHVRPAEPIRPGGPPGHGGGNGQGGGKGQGGDPGHGGGHGGKGGKGGGRK